MGGGGECPVNLLPILRKTRLLRFFTSLFLCQEVITPRTLNTRWRCTFAWEAGAETMSRTSGAKVESTVTLGLGYAEVNSTATVALCHCSNVCWQFFAQIRYQHFRFQGPRWFSVVHYSVIIVLGRLLFSLPLRSKSLFCRLELQQ